MCHGLVQAAYFFVLSFHRLGCNYLEFHLRSRDIEYHTLKLSRENSEAFK